MNRFNPSISFAEHWFRYRETPECRLSGSGIDIRLWITFVLGSFRVDCACLEGCTWGSMRRLPEDLPMKKRLPSLTLLLGMSKTLSAFSWEPVLRSLFRRAIDASNILALISFSSLESGCTSRLLTLQSKFLLDGKRAGTAFVEPIFEADLPISNREEDSWRSAWRPLFRVKTFSSLLMTLPE